MDSASKNNRRVTIKDVARLAGISPTTVSNVLNGKTDAMTEDTLARIQDAMRALNYRPSSVARGLVTHRTATIGLILSEIETPLFLQAINHIEPLARDAGYNILISNARTVQDELKSLDLLLEKQVDGIIFLSISEYRDDLHLLRILESGTPLVLINRSARHENCHQLNWDNAAGVAAAVDYLVGLGHRRIAMLRGPLARHSSDERLRGYKLGLERNGLALRQEYVRSGDFTQTPEAWSESTRQLLALPERPTAVIASDDIVAAVVMRTLEHAGLKVPHEISVVGIDDQPFGSYLNPALTTVKLPVIEAGKRAVEILLKLLAGEFIRPVHLTLPCPLVIRESSAPPPVRA